MSKILVITYHDMAVGYKLAGLDVVEVKEGDDFSGILTSVLKMDDIGILAVEDTILDKIPGHIMKRLGKMTLPLIVPISTPSEWKGGKRGESYIERLIRRAVGYQIKIKGSL
ncbi:MAG: V-type ATP synthase subunit F [Nitrospinae bacterium]|nr:V-type ATP synthase subunit F [Nitrospinota bacterium]